MLKNLTFTLPCWRDLLALCKLRVVAVLLISALAGFLLARPEAPSPGLLMATILGIGLMASAAAALNHLVDRQIDPKMARTRYRPLPGGRVTPFQALCFACLLAVGGVLVLVLWVNLLTAWLTLGALLGYALIYSYWLKPATPQNIVIGGLAGASPPLLGWVAATGRVEAEALLLTAIVFVWTPPHFWSLCLYKRQEYAQAEVPMLPVSHGDAMTRRQIQLYGALLVLVSTLPVFYGRADGIYFLGVTLLNLRLGYWLWRLSQTSDVTAPLALFWFSIKYLLLLFLFMLLDHYEFSLALPSAYCADCYS